MRPSKPLVFFLVLCAACGASGATGVAPVAPPEMSRLNIAEVLDELNAAAAAADEERYFALYTDDAVFLGTDASERWTLDEFRTYAHPFFERGRAWTFHTTRREITYDGTSPNVAWFDEDLETGMGPARGSGVMRLGADSRWRIAQYNLALTIPNERLDEVKALLQQAPPEEGAVEDSAADTAGGSESPGDSSHAIEP